MADKPPKPPNPDGREAAPRHKKGKGEAPQADTVQAAKSRLKALSREIPSDNINRVLLESLNSRPSPTLDRSIVIIGAAMVENALEVAILSQFVALSKDERRRMFDYEHNGPLASFDNRIKMAAALGLMGPKTRGDLDVVRTLRNHFAHIPQLLDFQDADIASLCSALHIPTTVTLLEGGWPDNARDKFVLTILTLVRRLKADMEQTITNAFGTFHLRSLLLP